MGTLLKVIKNKLTLLLILLLNMLPVKKNKLFLYSYYGSQYGCNPKYITEYILKHYPKDYFDLVWAFNDLESKTNIKNIRKVKNMSFKYFYELCTSKVVITNYRTNEFFIKRKNQYYIQTWHSSLRLKQIEKDAEEHLPSQYIQMAKKDSLKCDLLLAGCHDSTEILERSFWYNGEIFKKGIPRNDFLFHFDPKQRQGILTKLGIPEGTKVILYAPTFRKGNSTEMYNLDYSSTLKTLKQKFSGNWVFLVRLHPHLLCDKNNLIKGEHVMDVTAYDDIQELLSISDILISDYSSMIFDFSITKRPCFLYVPDLLEYTNTDRKLYYEISDLPFISAINNTDLNNKILHFNAGIYQNDLSSFLERIETYENGKASESLLNHIEKICFNRPGGKIDEFIQNRVYNRSV
ncbi:glycerophosphotransferase [Peribacillus muralis]|uniref:CDP-glycerol glycerophosphotransferase family protein n=1 Tax=Peribacillus muralis TaxID=264697 RepID=UPI001F4EC24E|nr:CDP-glycerol glycerophosphotransferase family protein [Peribacillus muralis]MCK1993413.1 CDP-glycerol glycerophosphotransferase family protein [Peribacillus muralis]MCK2014299.1 CDP-glycerol glycerophosphotransferase family protein [Peribacillus muralis]